jgi:hypothetical protein
MATSGSINFRSTRDEVVKDALQTLSIIGENEEPNPTTVLYAIRVLNRMLKSFMTQGLHLWTYGEATLFFDATSTAYSLGSGSSDARCVSDAVITQLTTAASAPATTLVVTSTTGMLAGDNIGIVLDSGSISWTTIVSVDSSTGLTITTGIASAAAVSNNVYTYTNKINRPQKVHSCRLREGVTNTTDVELTMVSRQEYYQMANKNTETSNPTIAYYDPQLSSGLLHLYGKPSSISKYLVLTYERTIEDVDSATDNFDLPVEWEEAIVAGLVARLAPFAEKDIETRMLLKKEAQEALYAVLDYDNESTTIQFIPDNT